MKNILALIGLVVVLFVGLGWYLEWYKLGAQSGDSGQRTINVDANKVNQDIKKGGQKVGEMIFSSPEKKVEAQPTGLHVQPDGTTTITLPKIEIKTGN